MKIRSPAAIAAIIIAGAAGIVLGSRLEPPMPPASAVAVPPIRLDDLRDTSGARATPGELKGATVVMLSSLTCVYCKETLTELSRTANGRKARGLWLVTLQGAEASVEMLTQAGVDGARPLGPATSSAEALLTFQAPGTPVFALLDSTGRTVRVLPGYPGRERMKEWFAVMLGEG
jgi:hypothetical protein